MATAKRYFWLKLKEDFFSERHVKALRKLPQGDTLVIVYLKMQLISLKTEGIIHYEHLLPDSVEELALAIDEEENVVRLTVEALIRFGVVERWADETLYMAAAQQLIGSETAAAERVRRHRATKKELENTVIPSVSAPSENGELLHCNADETKPLRRDRDRDRERDRDRDRDREIEETPAVPPPPLPSPKKEKQVKHKYGEYKNVLLTDEELDKLKSEFSDWEIRIERLSSYIASSGKRYKSHLATIRNWASRDAETGYQGKKTKAPAQTFVPGEEEKMAIERLRRERADFEQLKKFREELRTAGNDPEIAARAENLKKQLGG